MEPIESNSVLTFSVCFVIFLMILFVTGYFLVQWGIKQLKNENEYELMYSKIEDRIDKLPVNHMNYNMLLNQLAKLGHMKHRNREKTEVLTVTFLRKFKAEAKRQVEEND